MWLTVAEIIGWGNVWFLSSTNAINAISFQLHEFIASGLCYVSTSDHLYLLGIDWMKEHSLKVLVCFSPGREQDTCFIKISRKVSQCFARGLDLWSKLKTKFYPSTRFLSKITIVICVYAASEHRIELFGSWMCHFSRTLLNIVNSNPLGA